MKKPVLLSLMLAEIKDEGLPTPETEVRFHQIRKWRFDLGWPKERVALEVHGGVYAQGHHTRGKGFEDDREKMNEAQLLGWRVFEYSTRQIKAGSYILDLKRALA